MGFRGLAIWRPFSDEFIGKRPWARSIRQWRIWSMKPIEAKGFGSVKAGEHGKCRWGVVEISLPDRGEPGRRGSAWSGSRLTERVG
jgi:hypothetical protein